MMCNRRSNSRARKEIIPVFSFTLRGPKDETHFHRSMKRPFQCDLFWALFVSVHPFYGRF